MSFGKRPHYFFFDTDSFKSIFNFLISLVSTSSSRLFFVSLPLSLFTFLIICTLTLLSIFSASILLTSVHCFPSKKYVKDIYSTPATNPRHAIGPQFSFPYHLLSLWIGNKEHFCLPPTHAPAYSPPFRTKATLFSLQSSQGPATAQQGSQVAKNSSATSQQLPPPSDTKARGTDAEASNERVSKDSK